MDEMGHTPEELLAWMVEVAEARMKDGKRTINMKLAKNTLAMWIDRAREALNSDICGLCGRPGADKIPHPIHWPGEAIPDQELVHASCEDEECRRAHAALSNEQRQRFLQSI